MRAVREPAATGDAARGYAGVAEGASMATGGSEDGKDRRSERGTISAEDRVSIHNRLSDLDRRLDDVARRRAPPVQDAGERGAAMGQAFKIALELVVGVAFGAIVGWALDRFFGTSGPWFLIVFLVLGFAAGMLNVIRTAQRLQAQSEQLQRSAPSVKDDPEKEG